MPVCLQKLVHGGTSEDPLLPVLLSFQDVEQLGHAGGRCLISSGIQGPSSAGRRGWVPWTQTNVCRKGPTPAKLLASCLLPWGSRSPRRWKNVSRALWFPIFPIWSPESEKSGSKFPKTGGNSPVNQRPHLRRPAQDAEGTGDRLKGPSRSLSIFRSDKPAPERLAVLLLSLKR